MSNNSEFEFLSLVDQETISLYLQALLEGFKNGQINLQSKDNSILLDPEGLMKLEIIAKNKSGRSKVQLKISWKNQPRVSINKAELNINSKG